ncbi:hypothetical protein F5888DRAFT_1632455 [Russula emetica]|nr:hypothetical protein F5888DRAFT_1632455 [Russula emetica]
MIAIFAIFLLGLLLIARCAPLSPLHGSYARRVHPRVGASSGLFTPIPRPWEQLPAPPQFFSLGIGMDWNWTRTIKDKRPEICRVHAPRAPSSSNGRYDEAPGQHACGGASQPSPPHTQGSDEITSLRKLQLYALLGRIGGVEGVEGLQRAVEIMIIDCEMLQGWWRCNITLRMGY